MLLCCRTFARLAEDPTFHFTEILEPGTIEVVHNPTILHSRGDVTDGEVQILSHALPPDCSLLKPCYQTCLARLLWSFCHGPSAAVRSTRQSSIVQACQLAS